jgi:lipoprotein-anchoring transpeptidase ErfK/SrfK
VLVLRQGERTLELFEDHEPAHEWPVAVGQGGSPTPTGTFTVGAKRFEPTWVNPSPNGWGSDMPARIGPGPENPLGIRALNWNDENGRDTLIRFHGTPNEDSIGEAASQGCVRMFNDDVADLYDLVPSGTVILSVN